MNNQDFFQQRIDYQGDLRPLLIQVCKDYQIGEYCSHEIIPLGYEDFNLLLITSKGKFFVKIFAAFRDREECRRYVDIIENVIEAGVFHPKLYKSLQGFFYQLSPDKKEIRLCVMEYIEGKNFYELKTNPSIEETQFIIKQAALINKIKLRPRLVYDNWAITNFLEQYERKKQYLQKEEAEILANLVPAFHNLSINDLPHCFVHGDIIKTNAMRANDGQIYILDFAVANFYPRIQELAVLLCDMFFDANNPDDFEKSSYRYVLDEYQKHIPLTHTEIRILPLYVIFAHAMHVLCASYEKVVNDNKTEENEYFLDIGRIGLQYTSQLWKNGFT